MADSSTREANMERRRQAIFAEAQRVIGEHGFDALNLRSLAEAASVTVPTIYNLIGAKDDILIALMERAVTRIEDELRDFSSAPALEQAEAVVIESTAIFAADENFFRAAMIAGERLESHRDDWSSRDWINRRSTEMAAAACRAGLAEGLLRGDIGSEILGAQMYALYRTALHDWTYQQNTIEQFRRRAMAGFYVCLAADATPDFRQTLLDKLGALMREEPMEKAA